MARPDGGGAGELADVEGESRTVFRLDEADAACGIEVTHITEFQFEFISNGRPSFSVLIGRDLLEPAPLIWERAPEKQVGSPAVS
jgi:hypothetical protein